jgi:hypothetical protein
MNKHQNGRVRLTVNYGYDIHSIEMPASTWRQIQAGKEDMVKGQGFYIEGVRAQDFWIFNTVEYNHVWITADDGFDVFSGGLDNVTAVEV